MVKQQLRAANGMGPRAGRQGGFTLLQTVIVVAVASIIVSFAVFGVTRARASIRLTGSARVLASYLERARADAVRRRGWTRVSRLSNNSYRVEMDLNGDGVLDTRDVTLDEGVAFSGPWADVTFNWRGRIDLEVPIGLFNSTGTTGINVSGSGDVTLDSEVFEDASIPSVVLNAAVTGDLDATASLGNVNTSVPYPTPTGNSNSNTNTGTNANSNTGTNSNSNTGANTNSNSGANSNTNTGTNSNSNTGTNTNSNGNTNGNTNTNSNANSNTNTGTQPCSISVSPSLISVVKQGSATVTVSYSNMSTSNTLTATVSNSGQLQASPTSKTILGSGSTTFTVAVKQQDGSVTFAASPCGVSMTVPITVLQ